MIQNPTILFVGIYPKETKTLTQKDICTPMFIAALFTVAKIWKKSKCVSIDAWIEKIPICAMEYHQAIKRIKS